METPFRFSRFTPLTTAKANQTDEKMSGSKEGVIGGVVKLCLFFLFFINGLCKLTPKWGEDIHASMDAAFRERYTPFWQQSFYLSALGVELDPTLVRLMFGSTEIVSAIMLYTRYKIISSIMLFGLMSAVVLTHLFLGEFSEIPMPLVLCFTSLGVCFIGGG